MTWILSATNKQGCVANAYGETAEQAYKNFKNEWYLKGWISIVVTNEETQQEVIYK